MRAAVRVAALAAGALLAAAPLAAQKRPALVLDAGLLRPGMTEYEVRYVLRGDTVQGGTVRDVLTVTEAGGRRVVHRRYLADDDRMGRGEQVLVDAFPSLTAVSYHQEGTFFTAALRVSGGRVTGWTKPAGGARVDVDETFSTPLYQSGTFDLHLRASPLAVGWEVAYDALFITTDGVASMELAARVTAEETVAGRPTWRVEATFAAMPVRFWIDRETRDLVQAVMPAVGGGEVVLRIPGDRPRPRPGDVRVR